MNIKTHEIAKKRNGNTLKHLKTGKTTEVDNLPIEILKADSISSVELLQSLLNRI